jgi:NADPH:quinone reductase-like Zn-dependent oxidoreductase
MEKQMRALVCTAYGTHEVLETQLRPVPTPKAGEVLVEVYASGITRADSMMRQGTPKFARVFLGLRKPKKDVIGTGFSGRIVKIGEGVQAFKVGDEVFGCTTTHFGANAEFLRIHQDAQLLPKPKFLSHAEACTLADGPLTSFHFLKNVGQVRKADKVLIIGASGSLGLAAIQFGRVFEAEVSAVCSAANSALVTEYGAEKVIAYDRIPLHSVTEKYDLIFDTIGASSFRASKKHLKRGGRYVTSVLSAKVFLSMLGNCRPVGKKAKFSASGLLKSSKQKAMLKEMLPMLEVQSLKIHIEGIYTLDEAREVHKYVDSGRKRGNVVFRHRADSQP